MKDKKMSKEKEKKILQKLKIQIKAEKKQRNKDLSNYLEEKLKKSQKELNKEIQNIENQIQRIEQGEGIMFAIPTYETMVRNFVAINGFIFSLFTG